MCFIKTYSHQVHEIPVQFPDVLTSSLGQSEDLNHNLASYIATFNTQQNLISPLGPILSNCSPVYFFITYFFKIQFNIILPSILGLSERIPFHEGFQLKYAIRLFHSESYVFWPSCFYLNC
jgi:hypothetical protein